MDTITFFRIGTLLNFLLSLLMGLFVFIKNPRLKTNRIFLYLSLCVASWALLMNIGLAAYQEEFALLFARLSNLSALMLSAVLLHFILSIIGKEEEKRKIIILSYLANTILIFLVLIYPHKFVGEMRSIFGLQYTSKPGILFHIFTLLFFLEAGYATAGMIKVYPSLSDIKKIQLKYVIITNFIGIGCGGMTFLTAYGLPLPPYPALFTWLYVVTLGYVIIKYRFLEIETVVHRTILWFLTSITIFMPIVVFIYLSRPFLAHMNSFLLSIVITLLFFIFKYYHSKIQPKIDHIFRRRKYDYSQILSTLSLSLRGIIDVKELSRELSVALKKVLYLKKISILIKDKQSEGLIPVTKEGFSLDIPSLQTPDNLLEYLEQNTHIETGLVDFDPSLFYLKSSPLYKFLKAEDIPLVVVLKLEKDFIGIIILGKKQNLQEYTLRDIKILENISFDISLFMYNALHHQDILEKQRLEREVELARKIQENLLPRNPPQIPGLSLSSLYVPAKEIGGDYYDFIVQGPDCQDQMSDSRGLSIKDCGYYISIGDVSGKGLDAGLVASFVKSYLSSLIRYGNYTLKEMLNILNRELHLSISPNRLLSLVLLRYRPAQPFKLTYCSAAQEYILIYRANVRNEGVSENKSNRIQGNRYDSLRRIEAIRSEGAIMGAFPDITPFLEEHTLTLYNGDKILIYSDGVTEARNAQDEFFGLAMLEASFQRHASFPMQETLNNIYQDIKTFTSNTQQYDDITLVGIEKI
jgi:serine phosphatase RsbU (regulator of sigma subunit)